MRRDSEYEWAQHIVQGLDAGLTREEITAAGVPMIATSWSPLEAAILTCVDELIADAKITDATWATLAAELETRQIMDLIFTVGSYDMLAMLFRSAQAQPDEDLLAWKARYDAGEDQP
jgi:alkylhydroperoxidase family enzyme